MKKSLRIVIVAICLSSCVKDTHLFRNYPEIITKYQLEDLHDRAKWEVYKLYALSEPDYLVNFESDSIRRKFYETQTDYEKRVKNLLQDKYKVQKIVGEKNILPFLEADLNLMQQDSSEIFRENEIVLTFFPKNGNGKYWQSITGFCHTIIFQGKKEVGIGCKDYFEFEILSEEKDDKQFIQLLKEKKDSNPWLEWYLNKREH